MYMYIPVYIAPATLGRNLWVNCRWESIAASILMHQTHQLLSGVCSICPYTSSRLYLIGGISIAPRMEPTFIALPVYEITNHPDTCLQMIWSNVIKAKCTVEHTEGDTDNKIVISFCDGQANSCCNGFFNISSDYTPSRCLKQKWILAHGHMITSGYYTI